jgi:inositol-phosphate phosphatase / L-galactose 1-phosphate phosphatase
VTDTDKRCEALILSQIRSSFPSHAFIGEEGSAAAGATDTLTATPTWMVDPVDGTTNFVHRFPFSCVSIGLVVDKIAVVGVVYNPILDELFHAVRGGGAFLNGQAIRVSDTSDLRSALVATEIGTRRDEAFMAAVFARMQALTFASRSVRCCGSCALNLCGVACGRLDAYYEAGLGGPWDMAAAALVVEEAGGKILDPEGGPFDVMSRRVLGSNGHLAGAVAEILAAGPWAEGEPRPTADGRRPRRDE